MKKCGPQRREGGGHLGDVVLMEADEPVDSTLQDMLLSGHGWLGDRAGLSHGDSRHGAWVHSARFWSPRNRG